MKLIWWCCHTIIWQLISSQNRIMNRANHVRKFMHSIEAAFYLLGTILIEMSILIKVIFMKIREKRLLLWHRVIQVSTRMHITYQTVLRCILYLWEGMFIHWSVHLDPFPTLKLSVTLPAFSPPFCAVLLPLYAFSKQTDFLHSYLRSYPREKSDQQTAWSGR